jgi:FkbM family methyltransferase
MIFLLKAWSLLPNIKGKLWIGNKLYQLTGGKQAETKIRNFWMNLNLEDRIQRRIFLKKSHEPETEFIFEKFFKEAKCFFDIGGNIGYFSLLGSAINPDLQTYAFEPLPSNISTFKKNIELNKGFNERIHIVEKCLSDSSGEVTFFVPPDGECGWGTMDTEESNEETTSSWPKITREALTFDEFIEKNPSIKPDLIKIDVEGSEINVLKGALNYLENNKVLAFCIELNEETLKAKNYSSQKVIDLMSSIGYVAHYISDNSLIKTDKPVSLNKDLNYFFIPSN